MSACNKTLNPYAYSKLSPIIASITHNSHRTHRNSANKENIPIVYPTKYIPRVCPTVKLTVVPQPMLNQTMCRIVPEQTKATIKTHRDSVEPFKARPIPHFTPFIVYKSTAKLTRFKEFENADIVLKKGQLRKKFEEKKLRKRCAISAISSYTRIGVM